METLTELSDLKIINQKSYRPRYKLSKNNLSSTQQFLYDKCLKGLKSCPNSYLKSLSAYDKKRIIYNQNDTWRIINKLKQDKLNTILSHTILNVFPDIAGNSVDILLKPVNDSTFIVCDKLKELIVSTNTIINKLIKENILPKDFYEL